jgi:REP element-mobilizing transposase RayT
MTQETNPTRTNQPAGVETVAHASACRVDTRVDAHPTQTRHRLPHEYPAGKSLFLTWHLHGAARTTQFPPPGKLSAGQTFVLIDRFLDTTRQGPHHLKRPEVAQIIVDAIHRGVDLRHYDLHAYVVMSNHVHLLITPLIDPSYLMKSLKGATARAANKVLGLTGVSFWQKESYDHWVRNTEEFQNIWHYIETNPVKAGLVATLEEYRWSSASVDTSVDAAR